jgi:competence protein ComEA
LTTQLSPGIDELVLPTYHNGLRHFPTATGHGTFEFRKSQVALFLTDQPLNNSDRPDTPVDADSKVQRRVLNRTDQRCVATLTALAMFAIGSYLVFSGVGQPALLDLRYPVAIEIDQVGFQLDVNAADWPEWTLLPRIGETLARRIVESRNTSGLFQTHDDLRRVSGIGPKTLANMRPYLLPIEPNELETTPLRSSQGVVLSGQPNRP